MACHLRKLSVNVAMDFSLRKVDKQIKSAEKLRIPHAVILKEGDIRVFNLKTKETVKVKNVLDIAELISSV